MEGFRPAQLHGRTLARMDDEVQGTPNCRACLVPLYMSDTEPPYWRCPECHTATIA